MATIGVPYAINSCTVVVHEAEEGGYWGEVLELPGCVSQGETQEELRQNIREALESVLDYESQTPRIEIQTEPILSEKEFVLFGMPVTHGEQAHWVELGESVTATA